MKLRMRRADGQQKQTTEHSNNKHCKIHYNLTMQLRYASGYPLSTYAYVNLDINCIEAFISSGVMIDHRNMNHDCMAYVYCNKIHY